MKELSFQVIRHTHTHSMPFYFDQNTHVCIKTRNNKINVEKRINYLKFKREIMKAIICGYTSSGNHIIPRMKQKLQQKNNT